MRALSSVGWAAIPFSIALAFLPAWSFYFDVTPKAVALLVAAAAVCGWAVFHARDISRVWTSPTGRWNAGLAILAISGIAICAFSSPLRQLAWQGSVWRRFGAETQIAVLVTASLVGIAARRESVRTALLRSICAAGILASLYGITQYFGWDPFLDPAVYRFGEGAFQIVRPPGPFGHSNYLAAFLLWPIFVGAGLWRGGDRAWGAITMIPCVFAIVLCGSRGALVGLVAGAFLLIALERPSVRVFAAVAAVLIPALGAFYYSPFGSALRARVFWAGGDVQGGSRLLLWRDSLPMIAARPALGYGPDTFATVFPAFQSAELARAYPDFYHESPHNLFLDALVSGGIGGGLWVLALIGLGTYAGLRAMRGPTRAVAAALLAGLTATVVAHQFIVFIIPTGFLFLLGVGLLANLESSAVPNTAPPRLWMAVPAAAALIFLLAACRLGTADFRLARVRTDLDAGNFAAAAEHWIEARHSSLGSDLYFARRWMALAAQSAPAMQRLQVSQFALDAARTATTNFEQPHNAWYNLAMLEAAANDPAAVEASLRSAIAAAPTWYKPHWTLARYFKLRGRLTEAQQEARIALDLNALHDTEVTATMEEILRSPAVTP